MKNNKEDIIINKLNNSESEYKIRTSYKDLRPGIIIDASSNSFVKGKKANILRYSLFAVIPIVLVIGLIIFIGISGASKNNDNNDNNTDVGKDNGPDNGGQLYINEMQNFENIDSKLTLNNLTEFAKEFDFSLTIKPQMGAKDNNRDAEDTYNVQVSLTNCPNEVKLSIIANRGDSTNNLTLEEHVINNESLYNVLTNLNQYTFYITYLDNEFRLYTQTSENNYLVYMP